MTFQRGPGHIFRLSGASDHPLKTIGWTDGTWCSTFPHTTIGKYHFTSSWRCMHSLWWGNMSTILTCWGSRALVGMPQNRPNARNRYSNRQILTPRAQLPRLDVPPAHDMVTQTQEAFLTLAEMVSRHTTTINQEGPSSSTRVKPPTSGGREPSIGWDRSTSHVP